MADERRGSGEVQKGRKMDTAGLEKRVTEQLLEIAELHKKNNTLYQQAGSYEQELEEQNQKMQRMQQERELMEAEAAKKDSEISVLKKKIGEMSADIERLSNDIVKHAACEKALSDKIAQMENSKSWKITKPLRSVMGKIR